MSRLKKYSDSRYTKIAVYTVISAVVIFLLCLLLYHSGSFFKKVGTVIGLVLKPIVFGGILAYLFEPAVQWLEKHIHIKKARLIAVIITILVVLLIIIAIGFIGVAMISRQISGINFNDVFSLVSNAQDQVNEVWEMIRNWLAEHSVTVSGVVERFTGVVSNVKTVASDIFFSLVFAVYFLLDSGNISGYWSRVINLFIKPQTREKAREVLEDADRCFSGYIRGQFIDAVLVGAVTLVAMSLCQVPYAFVIALLTGIGNLIPYVGPVVGIVSLVVICLSEGAMNKLIVGGIVLIIVMTLDGNVINPRLLSSSIEIHPLLVFAAMIAGSAVGGLAGMLVAVPLAALLKIEFDKFIVKREAEKG